MNRKINIFLILSFFVISLVAVTGVNSTITGTTSLATMIQGGTIQAYNITNNEFSSGNNQGLTPSIIIGDGKVSPIWSKIASLPIKSLGTVAGSDGYIKAAYGKNSVYFLVVEEPDFTWSAMQWDSNNTAYAYVTPMENGSDIWIFGNPPQSGIYGDAYSVGQGVLPQLDKVQNLQFERILVNDSKGNAVSIDWEISRSYTTNDIQGRDVQFNNISQDYTVVFASNIWHKEETKVTECHFVFSSLTIGQVPAQISSVNTNPILVDRFLLTQVEFGLIAGMITIILTLYVPMFLKIFRRK